MLGLIVMAIIGHVILKYLADSASPFSGVRFCFNIFWWSVISCIISNQNLFYKSSESSVLTTEFCQALNEELMPVLLKNFQKLEGNGTLTGFLYQASITF